MCRVRRAGSGGRDGALLAVQPKDTWKRLVDGRVGARLARDDVWQAQTPQVFPVAALRKALEQGDRALITDESSAMEAAGFRPRCVEGHGDNLKVTYLDDLPLAEASLRAQGRL